MPSSETATTVGARHLITLLPLLPARPLVVGDGHDGSAPWVAATAGLPCDQLLRAKADRGLYRPAPPRTGKCGAPRKDGARFTGSDPTAHGTPDAEWHGEDAQGRPVSVACWANLHLKTQRDAPITVLRVTRPAARASKRDPRESWCWWLGGPLPPLAEVPQLYARRCGLEDFFKIGKQCLGWEDVQVLTLAAVRTLVALGWVAAGFLYELGLTLDWPEVRLLIRLGGGEERANRPVGKLVLTRGLRRLLDHLATDAILADEARRHGSLPPRLAAL